MAAKRIRIKPIETITTWFQVDDALAEIGRLDNDLTKARAEAQETIDGVKGGLKAFNDTVNARRKELVSAVQVFATANRKDIDGKSRKLTFGTIGWRKSTRIVIRKAAEILAKIKQAKATGVAWAQGLIRVREAPDKEAMGALTDAQLKSVGASRKVEDIFFVEIESLDTPDA